MAAVAAAYCAVPHPHSDTPPPPLPAPQPWGAPPTPLLPRWHLHRHAQLALPVDAAETLAASAEITTPTVLGDLVECWQHARRPADPSELQALARLVRRLSLPPDLQIVPAEATASRLLACPLSLKARNCVRRGISEGKIVARGSVTVSDLLSVRGLGAHTLIEIMCIAEAANTSGFLVAPPATISAATIPDVFAAPPSPKDAAAEAVAVLEDLWHDLPASQQQTMQRRILAVDPDPLREIGHTLGVSGEAVRCQQLRVQTKLQQALRGAEVWEWPAQAAAAAKAAAGPVCSPEDLEAAVRAQCDTAATAPHGRQIAQALIRAQAGYECTDGVCVSADAAADAERIRTAADQLADNVGLVDENTLRDALLDRTARHDDSDTYWETMVHHCGLIRINNHLALRDTPTTRAKAALMEIGRPATRDEIAQNAGLTPQRLGSMLSSLDDVARASKHQWAIKSWLADTYDGIPAEIIKRINRDGGATSTNQLIEELPTRFGVTAASVHTYLATPKFCLSDDGHVSLADPRNVKLRPLAETVHGVTANDARPYWRFNVAERFLRGYSLTNLPPEIAVALGCEPDNSTRVPVSEPAGCTTVSVRWRLTSATAASIGYLMNPLQRLEARLGDSVLFVLDRCGGVAFRLDPQPATSGRTPQC